VLALVSHAAGSLSIVPLGMVLFLAVLPNPVLAGVQAGTRELLTTGEGSLADCRRGLRAYWKVAAVTWLLAVPITAVILLNVAFYGGLIGGQYHIGTAAGPLEVIWLVIMLFWLSLHLYVFPLLLAQERPKAFLAYRNAAVLVLARPLFTVTVEVVWLAVLILAAATGLAAVIGLMLGAAIQQSAFLRIFPTFSRPS
jgi:hypothetical protein